MKRKRFFPPWLGALALLLLFLAALGTAGVFWLNGYLRSQSLTDTLSRTVSKALDVEGKFAAVVMELPEATSPGFSGSGPGRIVEVRADDIRAHLDMAALLRREWHISELEIARATLVTDPAAPAPKGQARQPPPTGVTTAKPWWRAWLPNRFFLARIEIGSLDLDWRSGLPKGRLTGAPVTVRIRRGQRWDIAVGPGAVSMTGQPPFALSSATVEYHAETRACTIGNLRANVASGTVEVSGSALPDLDVGVIVRGVDIAPWLNASIANQFSGRLHADARLTAASGRVKAPDFSGLFALHQAVLTNHPALNTLANATGISEYRVLRFDELRSDLVRRGERLEFSGLAMESRGLLRVEGSGFVVGNTIHAVLEVGLPNRAFQRLPGAASQVFKTERNGYRWTTVQVNGPLSAPEHDLLSRLVAAPFQLLLASITYPVTDFLPNAAREATSGAGNILKGAVGVVGGAARAVTTGKTDGLTDGAGNVMRGAGGILNSINPFRRREPRGSPSPAPQR